MSELRYNPPFVPGDILKIDFPESSIICLITGSADAGAVEEVLSGHPVRVYNALYFNGIDGFVFCSIMEGYLKEHAQKTGHLDWNKVTCGGADVAEVLFENQSLSYQLTKMTESRDYWMKAAIG